MDKVIGGIASHPPREEFLKATLDSIYDQFDEIYVYLNNYTSVPEFLNRKKVTAILSSDADGDLKALGKFYMANQVKGYYLPMDDDLIYPNDYAQGLISTIDKHFRKACVGVHATIYRRHPVSSYYTDKRRNIFYCYHAHNYLERVHMLGTGTMAFHTDLFQMNWKKFEEQKNMLDPQMCRLLHSKQIPVFTIPRLRGWIKEQKGSQEHAIWKKVAKNDRVQTAIINSIPKLQFFPCPRIEEKKLGGASIETGLLLWMIQNLKPNCNVVELGSGRGSAEIKKGFNLRSVEHNSKYLKSHSDTIHAPLIDQWYDVSKLADIKSGVDAYLIDGPPGSISDRQKLLNHLDLFNQEATFIIDDVNREDELKLAHSLSDCLNRELQIHQGTEKQFATI